ncbi:MAG: OmpA family protein, partial [Flavobacteriaceae bacterium]|nr:OmpA family protein [Flavobacteriaceae bacterium]
KTVYFSRNRYEKKVSKQKLAKNQRLILYKADVDAEGNWSNITKLPFNKRAYSSGLPVLNKDGTKLYFVSDRLPSEGKTDIFEVDILGDGKFGKPRNLGANVNTSGNETTPFITDDNILYFSSDGHPGKGNLDVFAVEVYEDSTSEVYQLASPINSINDDFAYIVNKDNNQGFFTSNRLQGKGFNDLYAFTLEEDLRPGECFITVDGKVKDKDSQEVIAGANVELYNLEGDLLEAVSTFDDGTYKFTVSCAKEYKLIASNENYKNNEKRIEILEENYHSALHTNLDLTKLYKEKKVIEKLQPIYYAFDDASITEVAAQEMDKIVEVMSENPELIIQASSYTDSQGNRAYNLGLSQRRAKAAVEYLKSQGIDEARIKSKAYGEDKLINQCIDGVECDDSAHQMNRRTEFNFMNIQSVSRRRDIYRRKTRLAEVNETDLPKASKKEKVKLTSMPQETETAAIESIENEKVVAKAQKPALIKDIKKENLVKNEDLKENELAVVKTEAKEPQVKGFEIKETINKADQGTDIQTASVEENKIDVAATPKTDLKNVVKRENLIKDVPEKQTELAAVKTVEEENNNTNEPVRSNQVKEEIIVNYKSSIVAVDKENNKALNYIESEKLKVIDEIIILEKKFEMAIPKYANVAGDLMTEKEHVNDLKREAESMEETGWSNIISYKNKLMDFNDRYTELTGESNQQKITNKLNADGGEYVLSNEDKVDKEILEENLRINNIEVTAMKVTSSGKYQKTSNAKKTDLIKVKFKLLHNEKVASGEKDAHIVLQNPSGKVTEAKGVFTMKDSNVLKKYTDHTVIDYNKNDIYVTMFIQRKGNNYEKGVYPVKFFVEGQLVGVSNLNLASAF